MPLYTSGSGTTVSVDNNGSLVGNESGIDFVAGTGITITATDDVAAGLVHLTFAASGGGGVAGGADYILSVSGGTVTASSPIGLSTVTGTDAGSVLQSCITNLGSTGGTIVFQRGTYTYNTVVPALPTGLTGWLRIIGNGAKIQLATGARRFLDVGRTGAGQTLQLIEVGGFILDGGAFTGSHSVIGTNQGGTLTTGDIAIDQLWIHDIRGTNFPSTNDATSDRTFIYFSNTAGSTVRWDNILLQRITVVGCDGGILFQGQTTTTMGLFVAEYVNWDRNLAPNGATAAEGFRLGGVNGSAERIVLVYCTAKQASRFGFYVTNCKILDARNCYAENCWLAGYSSTNANASPSFLAVQRYTYRNCDYGMTGTFVGSNSAGWYSVPLIAFGELVLDSCSAYSTSTGQPLANSAGYCGIYIDSGSANIRAIRVNGFKLVVDALTWSTAATVLNYIPLWFSLPTGRTILDIEALSVDVTGTRTVSGANDIAAIILAINAADALLGIDGYDYSYNVANVGNDSSRAFQLASLTITTQKIRGIVRGFRVVNFGGGDTLPRFCNVNEGNVATRMADINSWVRFVDCDLTNFPGVSSLGINIGTPSKPFVDFEDVRWKVFPKPSEAMGAGNFTTATFTTATGNQFIGGGRAEIHFANGTGAAITKIEVSKDGTTYEAVWTQASGVMAQDVFAPVDNGDFVKVTFTTTQPTTRVRYKR